MLELLRKHWLVFSSSVIALETEDITAASSAYFATPLGLSGRPSSQAGEDSR